MKPNVRYNRTQNARYNRTQDDPYQNYRSYSPQRRTQPTTKTTLKKPITPSQTAAQSLLGKLGEPVNFASSQTKPRGAGGAGGGSGARTGFYSPALEKLKHSYLTKDWLKPIDEPVGLSERERQGIYNLSRRQHQGALNTAMETMREKLGAVGWKTGESGIADSILAKMAMQGTEQMGQKATEIALNERDRRFGESMALENLNLGRAGMGLQSLLGGGGLEQFMKQFQQQQRQFGASHGLSKQKFEYGKEMDALNMLFGLGGYGQQAQQQAWQPYWAGMGGL